MGGFQKPSKSVFEIQFEMLSDNELDKLHKAKIAEINQKYKERINSTRENYSRVINFHRTRIREYIARLKLQFRNYVEALQSWIKTEIAFIDTKSYQINYKNIISVIKVWVFSVFGEIQKCREVARIRLRKEKQSIDAIHEVNYAEQDGIQKQNSLQTMNSKIFIQHVQDIIHRIKFILSLNKKQRPKSALKQSSNSKKWIKETLNCANIYIEETSNKENIPKDLNDKHLVSMLKESTWVMNVKYFGHSRTSNEDCVYPRSYSWKRFDNEDINFDSDQKLLSGIKAYINYKNFITHTYQMIVNRLVRTAYLSDLTASKKYSKNDDSKIISESVSKSKDSKPTEFEHLLLSNTSPILIPNTTMPGAITQTLDDLDESIRHGVKSLHIYNFSQEISRLNKQIDINQAFLENDDIFPTIYILEEFENPKETIDQSEYEYDFEEDSKISQIINTSRTEKHKRLLLSRRYFLKLPNPKIVSTSNGTDMIDNFWEWPTCMRIRRHDQNNLSESESFSSNKEKNLRNSRLGKNSSAK